MAAKRGVDRGPSRHGLRRCRLVCRLVQVGSFGMACWIEAALELEMACLPLEVLK